MMLPHFRATELNQERCCPTRRLDAHPAGFGMAVTNSPVGWTLLEKRLQAFARLGGLARLGRHGDGPVELRKHLVPRASQDLPLGDGQGPRRPGEDRSQKLFGCISKTLSRLDGMYE